MFGLGGIAMHLFVFRRGEWDEWSRSIAMGHLLAFAITVALPNKAIGMTFGEMARLSGCYITGLYISMLTYRAFFHRLNKYPGPFLARLSTLYITAASVKKFRQFTEVQKLHSQHGDYVRIGES